MQTFKRKEPFRNITSHSRTRAHVGVDVLDLVALADRPRVRAQALLRDLVHALLGRHTTHLDDIKKALLVRRQARHLPDERTHLLDASASGLERREHASGSGKAGKWPLAHAMRPPRSSTYPLTARRACADLVLRELLHDELVGTIEGKREATKG
jgi:hypothetical protein